MALYEDKGEGGQVDERVRTVPDTYNDRELAGKAADDKSGWARVDETAPAGAQSPAERKSSEQPPAATPPAERPGAKGGEQK